jgi:hypothetical protein
VGAIAALLIFIFNIQPARANQATFLSLNLLNPEYVDAALVQIQSALAFDSPHIDDIRGDIARSTLSFVGSNAKTIGPEKTNALIGITYSALQENLKLHPLDIRTHILLSEFNRLQASFKKNYVAEITSGEHYLEQALLYSPRRQQIMYALADFKEVLGKNEEAKKLLEQSIKDDEKISEGYLRLVYMYTLLNKPDKAQEILNLAKRNRVIFSDQENQLIQQFVTSSSGTTASKK